MIYGNGNVLICIDEYNEGEMKGSIYSSSEGEPDKFTSAITLVKEINRIFDEGDAPQSTMKVRGFNRTGQNNSQKREDTRRSGKAADPRKISAVQMNAHGNVATFRVRIKFRQNASWQGELYWVEKNKEENFRSVLELLMLIDSSFTAAKAVKGVNEDELHAVNG